MPVEAHAVLGASSSHRWLACPPIVQFEKDLIDIGSDAAREGTAAHELAELKLLYQTEKINKRTYNTRYNKFKKLNMHFDGEMDECTDEYVDRVIEIFNSYQDAYIELEKKVDYSTWVPDGYGTSDVVIIADKVLEIVDLKYGKGVPEDAYLNTQLMLYALGAYSAYELVYDFDVIRMSIFQPRLDSFTTAEIPVEELLYWANNYVAPRAAQAHIGIGDWNFTEEVVRWSKVAAKLKPWAEENLAFLGKFDYREVDLLSLEEISEILAKSKMIETWLKKVEYYALEQVRDKGQKVPGFKLVEGRSIRKITDTEKVATILTKEGYNDIYKPKDLIAMGALEKLVGKKHLTDLVGDYIVKPTGKPVLVVEGDKREEIGSVASAASDFDDVVEDDDLY